MGEHINDHQVKINQAFAANGYVLMADPELTDLADCFQKIHGGRVELRRWENKDPLAVVRRVDEFIQENWHAQ